jgi:hypothetical protein
MSKKKLTADEAATILRYHVEAIMYAADVHALDNLYKLLGSGAVDLTAGVRVTAEDVACAMLKAEYERLLPKDRARRANIKNLGLFI